MFWISFDVLNINCHINDDDVLDIKITQKYKNECESLFTFFHRYGDGKGTG